MDNKPTIETLVAAVLGYDKLFGKPSEGSNARRAAYNATVEIAKELQKQLTTTDKSDSVVTVQ